MNPQDPRTRSPATVTTAGFPLLAELLAHTDATGRCPPLSDWRQRATLLLQPVARTAASARDAATVVAALAGVERLLGRLATLRLASSSTTEAKLP